MHLSLEKTIRDRAYFVAGREAWFREENDPLVESAINDATRFLKSFRHQAEIPAVSGATTTAQDKILVLYWLVNVSDEIIMISVSFLGSDKCIVSMPVPGSEQTQGRTISISELLGMDMPQKIRELRSPGRSSPFGGPKLH